MAEKKVAEKKATAAYLTETDDVGSIPPGLQDFLSKAEEAVKHRNYGYAIEMYRRILSDMPGNLWVRRRLRGTELKRDQEGKKTNPVVGTLLGVPTLIGIALCAAFAQHLAGLRACEAFLARVPTNTWVLSRLARHAYKLHFLETAVFSMENALEVKRNSVKNLIWLAELYQMVKRVPKAVQCLQVAASLRPNDRELAKHLNDMTATRQIEVAHLDEGEGGYRQSLADEEKSIALDREHRLEKTDDDLQRQIRKAIEEAEARPADGGVLRRVAGAYRAAEDWDNAYAWYKRASEVDTKDFQLKVMMGEMRRFKYRQVIREGEDAVQANPGKPEFVARLERLKTEFADYELEEFTRRAEAYPTDLEIKYELGLRYFARGDILQSVYQFQRSVREPKRSRASRWMLGRCFLIQQHPELAKEQFGQALEAKEILDDEEALNLYYSLAEAQEAMGDYPGALESLGRIYTVDVMFKDVQQKMERVRKLAKRPSERPSAAGGS